MVEELLDPFCSFWWRGHAAVRIFSRVDYQLSLILIAVNALLLHASMVSVCKCKLAFAANGSGRVACL